MTGKADTAHRTQTVFFGSGPVAAACLEKLAAWCDIEAVVTKPQPPHHKLTFPVIAVAEKLGIRTLYAQNRRELDSVMEAEHFQSQVATLIDYGIIVSQAVIDRFPLGIVNSHFSLLPEWRGADPITFSILSGQPQTGVSLMLLVPAMDEGPLLAQATYELPSDITADVLTADLIDLSDASLRHILPLYIQGSVQPQQQMTANLHGLDTPSYSRKLTKADSILDFTKPAAVLEREIRAYAEWPKSRTVLGGKDVIITKAFHSHGHDGSMPEVSAATTGSAHMLPDRTIGIATGDGILVVTHLKPAGKAEMTAAGFLAGHTL